MAVSTNQVILNIKSKTLHCIRTLLDRTCIFHPEADSVSYPSEERLAESSLGTGGGGGGSVFTRCTDAE